MMQTVAISIVFLLSPIIIIPLIIICLTLCFEFPSIFLPVFMVYVLWIFIFDYKISQQGGRATESFRNLNLWKYFANYFPVSLVKTADLDSSKNYLFACHPHSVLPLGVLANFASNATGFSSLFPGLRVRLCTLNINFYVPFYREWFLLRVLSQSPTTL